ncbi:phenylalanine--tRNA ligase subunit beta [Vaginisenegalia massiliensis]|uniref:phenylalanine--tRNA ligase subunit beta n=1 Tax=Vaginisenegalia massiliensis TaxID=2058294 RepID=UPI000F54B77C|nr:phenylalanine--tRNA ligase subunit beta [Vaginisenegalia massiliensis]
MYLSIEWLNDFLDLSEWSADVIADKMSRTGIEIEGVSNFADGLSHLCVGQVMTMVDHPDSDHLHICQVDVGQESLRQIVCGAPNVVQGAKVIVALPGATLPGGITIKEGKLRGQESNGMLCALQELGFSDSVVPKNYADGLFILPADAPVGADIIDYLKLDDPILELSITPNRADALSMYGSAYEIGAIVKQTPHFEPLHKALQLGQEDGLTDLTISIADPSLSDRYQLRLIQNVTIQESPLWLQMRLMKAGIRPLNNVVDITNYALLTYGQPMHAFDYDCLPSKQMAVQLANSNDQLTTLDGQERSLTDQDIVIASGGQALALAGVMGGLATEVTAKTKNVLLETAVFEPVHIRNTAKRYNLRSESSSRFEKGINQAILDQAGTEAAQLIAQLGMGQVSPNVKEIINQAAKEQEVSLAYDQIPAKLGIKLSQEELQEVFDRLGFGLILGENEFTVKVPARRWDIQIQADILEEIARIYGYDRLPTTLPSVPSIPGKLNAKQRLVRHSRQICESLGLNQTISYVLTSPKLAQLMAQNTHAFVRLDFPISEDRSVLRQSMMPALMEIAKYNHARSNKPLAFYEMGKVFLGQGRNQQPLEQERLAILISGQKLAKSWYQAEQNFDFYDLKGIVESYLQAMRFNKELRFEAISTIAELHPGRSARIYLGQEVIGVMGQIHPSLCKEFDLDQDTYFAELDFDLLLGYQRQALTQQPIPKFPSTSRDLALLVDENQSHLELESTIQQTGGQSLIQVELFDLYQGDRIQAGKKSLAYRLTFQDPQQTLTDDQVNAAMQAVEAGLSQIEGLEIR